MAARRVVEVSWEAAVETEVAKEGWAAAAAARAALWEAAEAVAALAAHRAVLAD